MWSTALAVEFFRQAESILSVERGDVQRKTPLIFGDLERMNQKMSNALLRRVSVWRGLSAPSVNSVTYGVVLPASKSPLTL